MRVCAGIYDPAYPVTTSNANCNLQRSRDNLARQADRLGDRDGRKAVHLIVYRENCSVQNLQLFEVLFSDLVERDLEIRHRHRRRAM